ncbi:MAG: hypothetical protein ACREDZ_16290 [Kiloniellales bacterium]
MRPKINPLKLNPLQCRTLVLLQVLAKSPETARIDEKSGEATIGSFPKPHGNHFHLGSYAVMARDASGLANEGVWKALERKGLARCTYPLAITLTVAGRSYDTGIAEQILHRADH